MVFCQYRESVGSLRKVFRFSGGCFCVCVCLRSHFAEIHCVWGPIVEISPPAYRSTGWLCFYRDCFIIDVCVCVFSFSCCWLCVCVWNVWFEELSEVLKRKKVWKSGKKFALCWGEKEHRLLNHCSFLLDRTRWYLMLNNLVTWVKLKLASCFLAENQQWTVV